jgi:hypothetical protein
VRTLYPYNVLVGDVRLSIGQVLVDGKPLSSGYINPDLLQIDFAGLESERWEQAAIEVAVSGPERELAGSKVWQNPDAVLQLNCGYSNTRQAAVLTQDPHVPARWTGTVEMDRDDWFGRATLRAFVHATVDGTAHRIIGVSDDWTLSFDDLPASPVHGSIRISWVDFENDGDRPYLKKFKHDPYYLRLDPEDPSLFLNRGFEGLEALLVDRRHRPGPEKALHDSTRGNIASDVWSAMFAAALDAVEVDLETNLPDFPREAWREVVLKSLLARIYPDLSPHDALVTAVATRNSGEGSGDLFERLLPAAAGQVRLPQLLRKGIALLEKDTEYRENGQ